MKSNLSSSILSPLFRHAIWLSVLTFVLTIPLHGQTLTDYVDPFIGTGGAGHTYPGATVPFGMVQVSPDTRNNDYKACAGYHYDDTNILGFSQTHLSGTGIGDMGDVLIQPVNYNPQAAILNDPTGYPYATRFSHDRESAEPGYYQVYLPDHRVNVELTATDRVALHRYAFEDRDTNALVIDLWHNLINWKAETTQWTNVQVLNDSTLIGYRLTHAWAHERYVYFAIRFSRPMQDWTLIDMLQRKKGLHRETYTRSMRPIKVVVEFDPAETAPLLVKVGISGVSSAGALKNLEEELPHWDFERVRNEAKEKWEVELGRIEIEADESTKRVFYSAMYHTFLAPVLYQDVDGRYRGLDHNFYESDGTNYTVFSLWDTFRALHPLFTLIQQERTGDMIRSMLDHYEQNTRKMLPVWSFHANETNCMVGYHAVPVIADAYLKGITGYDTLQMLDALVATANNPLYDGLDLYKEYGYIPIDLEKEAASKTLEYAFDDWSIARVADRMGQSDLAQVFYQRSQQYRNIFDPETGFMRAKLANGEFREPFDPAQDKFAGGDFTEANSWRYSWFAPHDVPGLIDLHGSKKALESKLDEFFSYPHPPDAKVHTFNGYSAFIGQYEHGNEPVHHVAYLYNYCDAPEKTQALVYQILDQFYTDQPDGLIGNDDCGQMSAWYIFSALGFYPMNPVGGRYEIGLPQVDAATFHLENGKTFRIQVENRQDQPQTIRRMYLNGEKMNEYFLDHETIMRGGTWRVVLK